MSEDKKSLRIGWAQTDITPQELPVYITGQFPIRVSEVVRDPVTATALVLEAGGERLIPARPYSAVLPTGCRAGE